MAAHPLHLVRRERDLAQPARPAAQAPHLAGIEILDPDPGAARRQGRIGLAAHQHPPLPAAAPASRARQEHAVAAVAEQMHAARRARAGRHPPDADRTLAPPRRCRPLPRLAVCETFAQRYIARELLVQQHGHGGDPRIGVETAHQRPVAEDVVEGGQDHPLVVGHVTAHHLRHRRPAGLGGTEVQRLEQAIPAHRPQRDQVVQIARHGGGLERKGEERGIRGHDQTVPQVALQAEPGHAERPVAIGAAGVRLGPARFRDPPGNPVPPREIPLAGHRGAAAPREGRALRRGGEEGRHQELEHRAAPRQQGDRAAEPGERPAEVEPVGGRCISLAQGDQARQARLGGEQVVMARVGHAGGGVETDPEKLAIRIVEEREIHRERPRLRLGGERQEVAPEGFRLLRRPRQGPPQHRDLPAQPLHPRAQLGDRHGIEGRAAALHQGDRAVLGLRQPGRLDLGEQGVPALLGPAIDVQAQAQEVGGDPAPLPSRHRPQDLLQHRHGVDQARAQRRARLQQAGGDLLTAARHGEQGSGQVAAVDGRDIARLERREGQRVDPVPQVAAQTAQPRQRFERVAQPRREALGAQIAEVPRRQGRQQEHPDVGRRGAMRDHAAGVFLIVVGRQPVVLRPHEALVEMPGPPRQPAQLHPVAGGEGRRRGRRGARHPERELRRRPPEGEQGQGRGQALRRDEGDPCRQAHRAHRPRRQPPPEKRRTGPLAQPARRLRRRRPFEQVAPGDRQPHQGAQDRIQRHVHLAGQERQRSQSPGDVAAQGPGGLRQDRPPGGPTHQAPDGVEPTEENRQRRRRREPRRPRPRGAGEPGPGGDEQPQQGRQKQAAPQIVEDHPAADPRQAVGHTPTPGGRHARQQPGEELPVAAQPAVEARHRGQQVRRKVLEQRHVRNEGGAAVQALEQVVAEQGVVRNPPGQAGLERHRIVDALAGEDPDPEQVLIHVRDRVRVQIETGRTREQPRMAGTVGAAGGDLDARLEHAVAGDDPALRVQRRPVERMRQRRGQAGRGAARQMGVGVEGEDEMDLAEAPQRVGAEGMAGVRRARQQVVQLGELAPLALPTHPDPVHRVPAALAVEQKKARRLRPAMPLRQLAQALRGEAQQLRIAGHHLPRCVGEVGEKRKAQVLSRIGQKIDLQPGEQRGHLLRTGEQRGHGDQRAGLVRQVLGEIHLRQDPRRQAQREQAVEDAHRQRDRRSQGEQTHHGQPAAAGAGPGRRGEGRHESQRAQQPHAAEIGETGMAPHQAADPVPQRRAVAERALQRGAPLRQQGLPDMPAPSGRGRLGAADHLARHLHLRVAAPPRQGFDLLAVAVPRGEIHPPVGAGRIAPQLPLDPAHALEKLLPIGGGERAQAEHGAGHPVGHRLGPGGRLHADLGRRAGQILQHLQPQQSRKRPDLADGEHRLVLRGIQERAQPLHLDRPCRLLRGTAGEAGHPHLPLRIQRERAPEPRRQVFLHLRHRGLDHVPVVEQPLGGAGETGVLGPRRPRQPLAGALEHPGRGGEAFGRRGSGSAVSHEDIAAKRGAATAASLLPASRSGRSWKIRSGVVPWAISRLATLP